MKAHRWGEASHRGWRPFSHLGFKLTKKLLRLLGERAPQRLEVGSFQTLLTESRLAIFQSGGLGAKVLGDRVDELLGGHLFEELDPAFVAVPKIGGAAETCCLLLGLTAFWGVSNWKGMGSWAPRNQIVAACLIRQKRKEMAYAMGKIGREEEKKQLEGPRGNSIVEGLMCCGLKPIHEILRPGTHAKY